MSAASADPVASATATGVLWALRVTVTVLAVLFVLQGFTGGDYLVGNEAAMDLHGPGAITIHVVSGLQTVIAAVVWGVGRGPLWPTALSALVFGAGFVQAELGVGGTLDYHLPLAMVLLIAVAWVLVWAWSQPARRADYISVAATGA